MSFYCFMGIETPKKREFFPVGYTSLVPHAYQMLERACMPRLAVPAVMPSKILYVLKSSPGIAEPFHNHGTYKPHQSTRECNNVRVSHGQCMNAQKLRGYDN
jgi:hypothetical protein